MIDMFVSNCRYETCDDNSYFNLRIVKQQN